MVKWQKWGMASSILGLFILIYLLAPIVTPFLIAGFFAYLGDPLVNRLIKWHLPRTLAVTVVFFTMFIIILVLLGLLIPLIQDQILLLVNKIPAIIAWLQTVIIPWLQMHIDIHAELNVETIKNTLLANWQQTGNVVDKIVRTVSHSGAKVVMVVINIVMVPVVTFYLLRDWPTLVHKISELIPRKIYPTVRELVSECNEVLGAFFRGQLLVMCALGIYYTLGLSIIGLDLALLIGITIAIFSIVPYLGAVIGLAAAIIATLIQYHDWTHIIYVLILFVGGHLLEGMVLTPLLIGDRIGLHPVAVIFAILAGGQLFGFFGVLLALPVAAVIMVWVRYLHKQYLGSQMYKT